VIREMEGKRILGILILVLFLGTVFAGLAQAKRRCKR